MTLYKLAPLPRGLENPSALQKNQKGEGSYPRETKSFFKNLSQYAYIVCIRTPVYSTLSVLVCVRVYVMYAYSVQCTVRMCSNTYVVCMYVHVLLVSSTCTVCMRHPEFVSPLTPVTVSPVFLVMFVMMTGHFIQISFSD